MEYEYVTCQDELAYKVNEGNTTPSLTDYVVVSEAESGGGISPLHEELYEEEEVVLDEWAVVKEEMDVEEEIEVEEEELIQQTPPRTVVLEETIRNTPVQERVGLKRSEVRKNQRTKPAKEGLGTKPSNFRQAHDSPGEAGTSNQRFSQRKSCSTWDTARSRQRLPRAAKSYPLPESEQNRIGGFAFPNCDVETSDFEDEYKGSSKYKE